jgi:hypothetical protein
LAAQPAQRANAVSRKSWSRVLLEGMVVEVVEVGQVVTGKL